MQSKSPLSPATTILPEILIEICSFNALFDLWDRYIRWRHSSKNIPAPVLPSDRIRDTINASHVCRTWRTILLSAPELWSNMVDPYDLSWTQLILNRSKTNGISFSYSRRQQMAGHNDEAMNEEMQQPYLERLRTYQLVFDFARSNVAETLMQYHLPNVEILSVICRTGDAELPDDFLSFGNTPKLGRLHVRQCILNRTHFSSLRESLTDLHLTSMMLAFDERSLLLSLAEFSRLDVLTLDRVYFADSLQVVTANASQECHGLVRLPFLRRLHITTNEARYVSSALMNILSQMDLPCLSIFTFESWFRAGIPASPYLLDNRLLQVLTKLASRSNLLSPSSTLKIHSRQGVTLYASPRKGIPYVPDTPGVTHLVPWPKGCFHVQYSPRNEIPSTLRSLATSHFNHDYLYPADWNREALDFHCSSLWPSIVGELQTGLGALGIYFHVRHLSIYAYTEDVDDAVMLELLRQCDCVVVLEDVNILLWEFLCGLWGGSVSEGDTILPDLEEISFSTSAFSFESCFDSSSSSSSGMGGEDAETFDDADSGSEEPRITWQMLRCIRFPELAQGWQDSLETLRNHLEPFRVEVE